MEKLSKLEVARRQLETAIEQLFLEKDPVSIHTLVMAAFGVLRNLSERDPNNSVTQHFAMMIRPGMEGEFWKIINAAANFFKHADRDPDAYLETFDPVANEPLILFCIAMCQELGVPRNNHFVVYNVWFGLEHPDLLDEGTEFQRKIVEVREKLKKIGATGRSAYLQGARDMLRQLGVSF